MPLPIPLVADFGVGRSRGDNCDQEVPSMSGLWFIPQFGASLADSGRNQYLIYESCGLLTVVVRRLGELHDGDGRRANASLILSNLKVVPQCVHFLEQLSNTPRITRRVTGQMKTA